MQVLHGFFKRRTIWWPTLRGWVCLLALLVAPAILWWFAGEQFLSVTERVPTKILVLEGWIGVEGIRAAKSEFEQNDYDFIVTTGGFTGERWMEQRWNYADMAKRELIRAGLPIEKIIAAPAQDTANQRTFAAATAAWRAIKDRGISAGALNVFTMSVHARRSRLVFEKAGISGTKVGVIAWNPAGYADESWWQASGRAEDFIKESAGYAAEKLFSSGR